MGGGSLPAAGWNRSVVHGELMLDRRPGSIAMARRALDACSSVSRSSYRSCS